MKFIAKTLASMLVALTCLGALAQDAYPSKPIRVVIPFPPGGAVDTMMRLIAPELSKQLGGQPIVVDNKPGGGAQIAAFQIQSAPADGYNVFAAEVGAYAVNPTLYRKLSYQPTTDFDGVAMLARSPMLMYGGAQGKITNLDAFKKAMSGDTPIYYGSFGPGTLPHIIGHMLSVENAKAKLTHVPYKGAPPAMQGIMGNEIDLLFDAIPGTTNMVRGGRAVALAIASPKRSSFFPEVPTFAEIGYPNVNSELWIGLAVKKGTPAAIVNKLNAAVEKVLSSPEMSRKLTELGYVREGMTANQFNTFIKAEIDRYRPIVLGTGVQVD